MKVLKENHAIKLVIKGLLVTLLMLSFSVCKAQDKPTFPFQGGLDVMNRFFKDSLAVTPDIIQNHATGTVIFKFTTDENGAIKNILIYYADDLLLTPPLIEAIRKSSHHWIIPDHEKQHDFLLTFSVNFNPPAKVNTLTASTAYKFYKQRKPITATDQIPVASATLLPTIVVNYDL